MRTNSFVYNHCLRAGAVVLLFWVLGCGGDVDGFLSEPFAWEPLPELPTSMANNAVASIPVGSGCDMYSFLGVTDPLDRVAIRNQTFKLSALSDTWEELAPAPGPPRVAASAVAMGGKIYLFGGYTVEGGGVEKSISTVGIYDPALDRWTTGAEAPVAVDDTVALGWEQRWIFLISGWSDRFNVDAVQAYDTQSDSWHALAAFPGTPVFGHNGAISGNELLIVDGVASGVGGFSITKQTWRGTVTVETGVPQIAWESLPDHPGPALYRAAAGALGDELWFHGGTHEPYNYNGLTYVADLAATPSAATWVYNVKNGEFLTDVADKPVATMDHRGLVRCGESMVSIGGMEVDTIGSEPRDKMPRATGAVWSYTSPLGESRPE